MSEDLPIECKASSPVPSFFRLVFRSTLFQHQFPLLPFRDSGSGNAQTEESLMLICIQVVREGELAVRAEIVTPDWNPI